MSSAKSTMQSLSFCNLTHLFTHGKSIPLSVLDQFCLPALSIGMFPSQELDHLLLWHSFFPLYYSILLFFFHIKEKDKKLYIPKRVGTGQYFHLLLAARVSRVTLEQSIQNKVSYVWAGFSLTWVCLVIESVLPRLVISSNHMEGLFVPPAWRTYTDSSYAAT